MNKKILIVILGLVIFFSLPLIFYFENHPNKPAKFKPNTKYQISDTVRVGNMRGKIVGFMAQWNKTDTNYTYFVQCDSSGFIVDKTIKERVIE